MKRDETAPSGGDGTQGPRPFVPDDEGPLDIIDHLDAVSSQVDPGPARGEVTEADLRAYALRLWEETAAKVKDARLAESRAVAEFLDARDALQCLIRRCHSLAALQDEYGRLRLEKALSDEWEGHEHGG